MDDESRGYGQYCPISRALEVLGERWSLLIVRDMLVGARHFNELARCNPGLSRTLLAKRLRQLGRAGLLDHVGDEYLLTPAGEDLREVVFGLGAWGARWQFGDPLDSELDPTLLMWWVHGRLDFSQVPLKRVVVEFRFTDRVERYWVMNDAHGPSLCQHDPGFGVDAVVESELTTMYQVWLGRIPVRNALRNGVVRVEGNPVITRRIESMLQLSPVAALVAEGQRPSGSVGADN